MLEGPNNSRHEQVISLRAAGLTYAEIGRRFGITKQRVSKILKPKPRQKPKRSMPVAMLTIRDMSSLLGVHANTVRRWSDRGLLKAYRISSRGHRRFRREDVDGFLREHSGSRAIQSQTTNQQSVFGLGLVSRE
jgi:excisionase family DNA binding protein